MRYTLTLAVAVLCSGLGAHAGADGSNAAPSWPIYHGDSALSGVADTTLPDRLAVIWRHKAGAAVSLPPVVGSNMVFFVADNGDACAITLHGVKVWSRGIGDNSGADTNKIAQPRKFVTAPMFVSGVVLTASDSGCLYALDSATGDTKWKYEVGDSVNSTANLIEPEGKTGCSVVVMSQADGVLHRVDLASGKRVWASEPVGRCDGVPGIGGDFVVFGGCDAALHVLSAGTGKASGSVELAWDGGQVAGGVAVSGDMAFVGTRGGIIVCADTKRSRIVWTNQAARGEAFATPSVTSNRVIVGSGDGFVYCLDKSGGKLLWSFEAGEEVLSPVVAGNKVVVSSGGTLFLLRLKDGGKLWSGTAGDLISSPAVFDGKVVIGTDDGFVIMYGSADRHRISR